MSDRRPRWILSWCLVGLLLSAACGGSGESAGDPTTPPRPRTVRAYITKDPASLSMLGKTDRNGEILAVQISDSLVQYDPELNLVPRVAESWKISDDRTTVTFSLRPGVRWHDGQPVTADDVVFTVNTVRDPAVENIVWASGFKTLAAIEAVDPATVRARYDMLPPDFLEAWRVPLVPRHLIEAGEDLLTGSFSRHPVGCGPFRFVSHQPDQEIVLEANRDYWDGPPQIDRLVLKIYADQRTAYQALLAGEIDIATVTSALWEEGRGSSHADRLEAFAYSMLSVWLVVWNQDGSNRFFTDPRVRQAMVLALDRPSFIASVVRGLARPGATTYHPDTSWADPAIEPWPHDPERAAQLLDEAGWRDTDGDGVRDKNGEPFRFSLMIPASPQQLNDQIAVWEQQSWADLGIEAEIDKLEWQAFRERRNAGRFHAASFSLTFSASPDHHDLYHSSAKETGFNFFGLSDPEIDRLIESGRATLDPVERRKIYSRLQARLHELEPLTCLFYFASPVLHDKRLQGVAASPLDYWRTTRGPRVWRWSEAPAGH